MRLYLAGPMKGYEELNRPAFRSVAKMLRALGHEIYNPADTHGDMPVNVETGAAGVYPREHWLRHDLHLIAVWAEGVALMPGWRNSAGACLEAYAAQEFNLPLFEIGDWDIVPFAKRLAVL
jgi:hypothetical protein